MVAPRTLPLVARERLVEAVGSLLYERIGSGGVSDVFQATDGPEGSFVRAVAPKKRLRERVGQCA